MAAPFSHGPFMPTVQGPLASLTIPWQPLTPVEAHQRDPAKFYIRAGMKVGGQNEHRYLEITDSLILHHICACDLNKPSANAELTQLAHHQCNRFRLCEVYCRYTGYQCPGEEQCVMVHAFDYSCRYVAREKRCKEVLEKQHICPGGHDFPHARHESFLIYDEHKRGRIP